MSVERDGEDWDLLQRVGAGDADALDALMRRYWRPLTALATRISGALDAEDIVLDVFVRIWQRGGSWRAIISVRSLLYRIARNRALNHRRAEVRSSRRLLRFQGQSETRKTPADDLLADELQQAFEAALERLSPRRREVFQLVRFDGLDYREAADVLGLSPQTAANHLSAALHELRVALDHRINPPEELPATRVQLRPPESGA
jgi:RNA polymerase sigma-70 factor (ECF subfamily)